MGYFNLTVVDMRGYTCPTLLVEHFIAFANILHASAVEVHIRRLEKGERKRLSNISMLVDGFHYDNSSEQVDDGPIDHLERSK